MAKFLIIKKVNNLDGIKNFQNLDLIFIHMMNR